MYLLVNPSDIYYLTGVRSHDPGEILLLLDKKEKTKKKKCGFVFCDLRTSALFDAEKFEIIDQRGEWAKNMGKFRKLNTDPDFLTQTLREKIESYGVKLSYVKSPVTQERIKKKRKEIEFLKKAQKLNKEVYEKILPFLEPGITEEEIARKIQITQLELGASGPSFPPIVAFGENTAVPHHSPTERRLQRDDMVLIDMGLIWKGYCSDMTRCISLNKKEAIKDKKDGSFEEIYTMLQKVTDHIISWAKPGIKVSDIDKKARKMLGKYEQYFTHSLGHGVGIDIHEAPHISSTSDEILEPGMIITIEPGIYIPGKYGARYEEMCVVSGAGLRVL